MNCINCKKPIVYDESNTVSLYETDPGPSHLECLSKDELVAEVKSLASCRYERFTRDFDDDDLDLPRPRAWWRFW